MQARLPHQVQDQITTDREGNGTEASLHVLRGRLESLTPSRAPFCANSHLRPVVHKKTERIQCEGFKRQVLEAALIAVPDEVAVVHFLLGLCNLMACRQAAQMAEC